MLNSTFCQVGFWFWSLSDLFLLKASFQYLEHNLLPKPYFQYLPGRYFPDELCYVWNPHQLACRPPAEVFKYLRTAVLPATGYGVGVVWGWGRTLRWCFGGGGWACRSRDARRQHVDIRPDEEGGIGTWYSLWPYGRNVQPIDGWSLLRSYHSVSSVFPLCPPLPAFRQLPRAPLPLLTPSSAG